MAKMAKTATKTATKKPTRKTQPERSVSVEIFLPDGGTSLYVGRQVARTRESITLVDAAWIGDTGRRAQFFAGSPDGNSEIEPYPDGVRIELPATNAAIADWPHALPRTQL